MLDAREQVKTSEQHRLAGIATRIAAGVVAVIAIVFFSFGDNRELVTSLLRETEPNADAPPRPESAPQLAPPTAKPAGKQESASEEIARTANNATAGPLLTPEGIAPDGKLVSKEDIGFAMQLLNFAQGPRNQEAPPPEKAKDK
jgi:hypothetical protein